MRVETPEQLKQFMAWWPGDKTYINKLEFRRIDLSTINTQLPLTRENPITRRIEYLGFFKCQLRPEGVLSLVTWLAMPDSVQTLSLASNELNNDNTKELQMVLENCETLKELYIQCNDLTSENIEPLLNALSTSNMMVTLNLQKNKIGVAGVTMLMESLSSLQKLILGSNSLGALGMAPIAEALTRNSFLLHLDLSENAIGSEGLALLASALSNGKNTTLQHLLLSRNGIDDHGAQLLATMLETNRTLRTLDLAQNSLTGVGVEHLRLTVRNYSCVITDLGLTLNRAVSAQDMERFYWSLKMAIFARRMFALLMPRFLPLHRNPRATALRRLPQDHIRLIAQCLNDIHTTSMDNGLDEEM